MRRALIAAQGLCFGLSEGPTQHLNRDTQRLLLASRIMSTLGLISIGMIVSSFGGIFYGDAWLLIVLPLSLVVCMCAAIGQFWIRVALKKTKK